MYTARLLLVLMLALGISAEAQTSRRSRSKSKTKKPAITKPVPLSEEPKPETPAADPEPVSEPAPEPSAAKPQAPEPTAAKPGAPLAQPGSDAAVVFAIPRTSNAEPAAIRLQAELTRLLSSKADVQLVDLGEAFPAPPPPSLQEADTLYEQGKEAYDNLDPEAAAGKFTSAAEAYEKHPAALSPQRLAKTFIFMGASQLLNGDKVGAKASFLRALAAEPGTQPDQVLFGSDVQTAFTDAQEEFNAQKPGTLDIDSKPSGARVTLRGDDLGVTPLKNVPVHPGRHPVVITLPGYVPYASYPQVAPEKNAELKPQLEPLPALAEVITTATRASTERSFDSDTMPPDVATLAGKLGVRYVVLAAVQQKKSDPAEAELQVWDVRTKNRLRGVEVELQKDSKNNPVAAADRVHGFLTGRALTDSSTPSNMPPMLKKPWFWAAVVGGAAVVTGGILYATQDRKPGSPTGPISGLPGLGF
ncbi:PEGA domain-containing protein [Hyalangium sp.]|uniref:PEGA domain-containing protein n=1 Tax=Hyalangium sp. TaxID=2028555 RepID=UPI002D34B450|nr:PEGA domain-containing protein [Hyalangium sp.]HYH98012.1 PEGA domain-containing protein [Hyalangium sp.]